MNPRFRCLAFARSIALGAFVTTAGACAESHPAPTEDAGAMDARTVDPSADAGRDARPGFDVCCPVDGPLPPPDLPRRRVA